jgi:hypothetical protein
MTRDLSGFKLVAKAEWRICPGYMLNLYTCVIYTSVKNAA